MSQHSAQSIRLRSPTQDSSKKYPEIKQRGYYSDVLGEDVKHQLAVSNGFMEGKKWLIVSVIAQI